MVECFFQLELDMQFNFSTHAQWLSTRNNFPFVCHFETSKSCNFMHESLGLFISQPLNDVTVITPFGTEKVAKLCTMVSYNPF